MFSRSFHRLLTAMLDAAHFQDAGEWPYAAQAP
jgi:hypothetical protein